jgi:hypothetical protein
VIGAQGSEGEKWCRYQEGMLAAIATSDLPIVVVVELDRTQGKGCGAA